MLRLVFGFLGLLVALAVAASLARSHLGWHLPFGPAPAKAVATSDRAVASGVRAAGSPAPVPRGEGSASTARARPPQGPPAPAATKEDSVFQRQDEALRRSAERYRRVDP